MHKVFKSPERSDVQQTCTIEFHEAENAIIEAKLSM